MIDQVVQSLQGVPSWLVVMLIAMVPVFELRGAIPVSLGLFDFSIPQTIALAISGNMVPALLILFGWDSVIRYLERHWPKFHGFMTRYHDRLHAKWQGSIDRYGPWALALFIAIPLPLSGVWSGAVIAWIFGLHRKAAFLSILAGVTIASFIVTAITTGSLQLF